MELFDIVTKKIVVGKKKNTNALVSLIRNLEKIKIHEMDLLLHEFDNIDVLTKPVGGWLAIHYATLNKDFRILKNFCELYVKNNLSLDFNITENKKSCASGFTALDIAVNQNNITNYIILKKFGALKLTDISEIFLSSNFNYSKKKIDDFRLPYENNTIFRFFTNVNANITFFLINNYIEKETLIHEFIKNVESTNQHFFGQNSNVISSTKSNYTSHLEKVASCLFEEYQKNDYPLHLLIHLFFEPLKISIENLYKKDYKNISKYQDNTSIKIFSNFIGVNGGNKNFNDSILFDLLNEELLLDILDISKKFIIMKQYVTFNKELIKFFDELQPLCLHYRLDKLAPQKNILKKKNKI